MENISIKAATLIGSEIIKLGNEINQKIKEGNAIYNLTIGDFNPQLFSIPETLQQYIIDAYIAKQTNYPPADGIPELKAAIIKFISKYEHLNFADDEVMVAGGGRPLIHAIYKTIVDPNDKVIYPVPSWNNNHYCHLSDAQKIEVPTLPENGFMPSAAELAPHLSEAVLLALCSPLNPTGTTFKKDQLMEICDLVLVENKRRIGLRKPLYVLYDQIYWMLLADGIEHYNPISLRPEMKPYTIFVDGISKSLAATGIRVGWGLGPAEVIGKMKSILGHIGAWAPKPEQVATAKFLANEHALNDFLTELKTKINIRFDALYEGIEKLRDKGFPVQIIKPEGAIYLSVQFALLGKKTADGFEIKTTAEITNFLLNRAQLAIVPFTAFGCENGTDWFRISIGTLKEEEIPELLNKLEGALAELSQAKVALV
ncbi:MAG: aminotransferase class I/II-fold pyridoxal phosphate-dependent enzyme [Bacteroidia bacterium]|nr:aminotransferase class I/II-fold pyridoxal phosphate-dependent enzyme [Bacteroidia bacterium]